MLIIIKIINIIIIVIVVVVITITTISIIAAIITIFIIIITIDIIIIIIMIRVHLLPGKRLANAMFNEDNSRSVLLRSAHNFCLDWMEPDVLQVVRLLDPKEAPANVKALYWPDAPADSILMLGNQGHTRTGTYKKADIVIINVDGSSAGMKLARVTMFMAAAGHHHAFVDIIQRLGQIKWSQHAPTRMMMKAEDIYQAPVHYKGADNVLSVLVPKHLT